MATGGLASTKNGARIRFEGGKHPVIDGPFAESKELVAGYAIFDLPSKAAAIDWAVPFGDVVKVRARRGTSRSSAGGKGIDTIAPS